MLPLVLNHPAWDPIALRLGPIQIHWYALMYLVGFAAGYALLRRRLHHQPYARITQPAPWTREDVEDLILGAIVGVIVGGRLGYVLFYKPAQFAANPASIFMVWQGGMSFHGGAIGVALALLVYAWRRKRPFLEVTDLLVPAAPIGLAAGRLGNFINGELWGRPAPASLPWAMVFPQADAQPRHPSQLYQFLGEGLLLFALLWWYARRERARGQISGAFVFGYGVFRFAAEYFREPDDYLGLLSLGLSMGQWLCVPMIVGGAALWLWARRADWHPPTADAADTEQGGPSGAERGTSGAGATAVEETGAGATSPDAVADAGEDASDEAPEPEQAPEPDEAAEPEHAAEPEQAAEPHASHVPTAPLPRRGSDA